MESENAREMARIAEAKRKSQEDYNRLKLAVRALHDAAVWHADRPCDAHALWNEVRFAAGLKQ